MFVKSKTSEFNVSSGKTPVIVYNGDSILRNKRNNSTCCDTRMRVTMLAVNEHRTEYD